MQAFAIDTLLIWFSVLSFVLFGASTFVSTAMRREYERYGLVRWRSLVGTLQLLAAVGLLVGFQLPWVGQFSAGGLALLMLCGMGVRIKIRDTVLQTVPAFAYLMLNAYLAVNAYQATG